MGLTESGDFIIDKERVASLLSGGFWPVRCGWRHGAVCKLLKVKEQKERVYTPGQFGSISKQGSCGKRSLHEYENKEPVFCID